MSIDESAVDDVLEHFGVKGMKWGSRKDGGKSTGNNHNTAKVVGVGIASGLAARAVARRAIPIRGATTAATFGGSYLGAKLMMAHLEEHGSKPMSSRPKLSKESIRKARQ